MERNNPILSEAEGNELVATWGNLGQRPRGLGFMLSFAYKRLDGRIPEPGDPSGATGQGLDDEDRALLEKVEVGFETVGELYNACKFRAAPSALLRAGLGEALALAREAAVAKQPPSWRAASALDRKAPWFQIKEDPQAAATSVYVILWVVDNLKTILAPILPRTAQKLHEYLRYDGKLLGTQRAVEHEEETHSHQALTNDHTDAIGTHSLRSVHAWTKSELPPGRRCGSRRRCLAGWIRV